MKAIVTPNEPIKVDYYTLDSKQLVKPGIALILMIGFIVGGILLWSNICALFAIFALVYLYRWFTNDRNLNNLASIPPNDALQQFLSPDWQRRIADDVANQSGSYRTLSAGLAKEVKESISEQKQLTVKKPSDVSTEPDTVLEDQWVDNLRGKSREDLF